MGCFLGCFGGEKELRRRKQRIDRRDPRAQRNRVENVAERRGFTTSEVTAQQRNDVQLEQTITPKTSTKVVPELPNKPDVAVVEQLTASPKKRVTFNANVTTYEPLPDHDNAEEKVEDLKTLVQANSLVEEESSISSSVASSYPPNHRYHNARDSDDEAEYSEDDLDDLEDDLEDCDEDDEDFRSSKHDFKSESSVESRTENISRKSSLQSSVLAPVENITQWKAAVLGGMQKRQLEKENLESNIKSFKSTSQEVSVDASLSGWLPSPELQRFKKTNFNGFDSPPTTNSDGCSSRKSLEDRPILGALTVEELRQISVSPSSKKKSPSKSPDEVPIIGSVGSYWSDSGSTKSSRSPIPFNGVPNTTSKYGEDQRVHWHSTHFESRLDRVLG